MTPLADTEWTVSSYLDGSGGVAGVLSGTNLTLMFSADGRVSGSGGCNGYAGSYTVAPPAITIGPLAATRRFCASPDGVMVQEAAFLAALTSAASFTSDGATLQLWKEDGGTAVQLTAQRPG